MYRNLPPSNTLLLGTPAVDKLHAETPKFTLSHGEVADIVLPQNFDGRIVWRELLSKVVHQGTCGSCWAFATSSALADRMSIQTLGKVNIELSPAPMVYCNLGTYENINSSNYEQKLREARSQRRGGCYGENLISAWLYLYRYGTTTPDCVSYTPLHEWKETQTLPSCTEVIGKDMHQCADRRRQARIFRAKTIFTIPLIDRQTIDFSIMLEIHNWGPVTTGYRVYDDFYQWDGKSPEVYEHTGEGHLVAGHAVVLVGWGEGYATTTASGGQRKYVKWWIVRNSWGTDWGDRGYFRIIRGRNEVGIEENVVAGVPDVPGMPDFPSLLFKMSSEDEKLRNAFPINVDTGYFRNVPSTDVLIRPEELPDYNTFVAANWRTTKPIGQTQGPVQREFFPGFATYPYTAGMRQNRSMQIGKHRILL